MSIQTVGLIFLAISAGLAGNLYADAFTEEIRREDGLYALLSLIGVLSGAGGVPLHTVYGRFSCDALEKCGFVSRLRKEGLSAALSEENGAPIRDRAALSVLLRFAKEIEVCPNTESVARCCEKYRALYRAEIETNREKKKTHAALSRKMGFFAAGFVLLFGI